MKLWLRNWVYLAAILLALPWLLYRSWKTGRYRQGRRQKFCGLSMTDIPNKLQPNKLQPTKLQNTKPQTDDTGNTSRRELIWVHGVSVGEIQLLAPLVRQLQQRCPELVVVMSTTTDSGMELAHRLLPDLTHFFFPLDFSWAVRKTLRTLQPASIVLAELELWPNLIDLAHSAGIPLIVVNGRLSEKSFKRYRSLRLLTHTMFRKLTQVVAQSPRYAERFIRCGCRPECVSVSGSIKFDNVHFDRDGPQVRELRSLVGLQPGDRVLVVGSTQLPEEAASCEALVRLRSHWPQLKLIVVPRHPDRFDEVDKNIRRLPVKLLRRSQLTGPISSADWEILLVDTVGELRWWWGLAEIAIVGGSFGDRGGQNMLEPAAYGANVAFGPNTSNFKDIAELLIEGEAADRIPAVEGMEDWIRQQLDHPEAGRQRGERARELIAAQQGATARTLQVILGDSLIDAQATSGLKLTAK